MCDIDADDVDEEEADEEQSDGTEGAGAEGQGRGRSRGKRKLRDVDAAGKKAKERGKYQKQEKGKKRCRTPVICTMTIIRRLVKAIASCRRPPKYKII